ncbi:AbrB family transcriptional regulator [Bacillus paranthracis]|uniref:AbrB family transcriptional regulator n=1 Tax=Bacillus paranthracis TaxID=2026186 RepID=A0A5M9GFT1_9BACI|nr:AbrB/MazE/SpoVT family DNA-binding domain-containing protein [Bacillus paranthracis]KAA8473037.1 AbrB family transcriptional regulator [Bacillus paranthracis]QPA42196.1 AbrB family transcriptional regulator [Bacillus paranthracis]
MKATGIIRHVDPLGRVVIPKELRNVMDIPEKTPLEIYTDKECIILKKYSAANTCMLTNEITENPLILGEGKIVLSPEGAEMIIKELQKYLVK